MAKVLTTLIFLFFIFNHFYSSVDSSHLGIRKDYECEIRERDFYIKDCYRNVELNLEDKKMIASALLEH